MAWHFLASVRHIMSMWPLAPATKHTHTFAHTHTTFSHTWDCGEHKVAAECNYLTVRRPRSVCVCDFYCVSACAVHRVPAWRVNGGCFGVVGWSVGRCEWDFISHAMVADVKVS